MKYHDETFEKFPENLGYFENLFKQSPGNLIDLIEVYKRSKVIDDYTEDTLVYSSEGKSFSEDNALDAVMRLRSTKPNISNADLISIFEKIKRNEQYLREQGIFSELIIDLGNTLELTHIMQAKEKAREFPDSNDDNDEPEI